LGNDLHSDSFFTTVFGSRVKKTFLVDPLSGVVKRRRLLQHTEPYNVRNHDHDNEHDDQDFVHTVMANPEPGQRVIRVVRRSADPAERRVTTVFRVFGRFMVRHSTR
jgi:hypothetical protein